MFYSMGILGRYTLMILLKVSINLLKDTSKSCNIKKITLPLNNSKEF